MSSENAPTGTPVECLVRRYGQWAGCPKGVAEDVSRCIESIHDNYLFHQCARKRGFGKDGLYCKQHAKRHPE